MLVEESVRGLGESLSKVYQDQMEAVIKISDCQASHTTWMSFYEPRSSKNLFVLHSLNQGVTSFSLAEQLKKKELRLS